MDHAEALKHLRTLINVASATDDLDEIQRILREMRGVIDNAPAAQAGNAPHRSVK
jgi:hypothetical protein